MFSKTKLAITWAELFLIALLVVGSLGIWAFVAKQVDAELKLKEPVEEYEVNTTDVVQKKANLAVLQAEVTTLQAEIVKQQVALKQSNAQLRSLEAAYPSLDKLPEHDIYPLDSFTAYWNAQVQVQSLEAQSSELETQIEALIREKSELTLRVQGLETGSPEHALATIESSYVDAQFATLTAKSGELQLSLLEQRAQVGTMEELYPELKEFSLAASNPYHPPVAMMQEYIDARSSIVETQASLDSLNAEVASRQAALIAASTDLTTAQRKAHAEFLNTQKAFQDDKEWQARQRSAGWILVYLAMIFIVYWFVAARGKTFPGYWMVLSATAAILVLLVAYQEFQVMGAALIGLAILVLLLMVLPPAKPATQSTEASAPNPAPQAGSQP